MQGLLFFSLHFKAWISLIIVNSPNKNISSSHRRSRYKTVWSTLCTGEKIPFPFFGVAPVLLKAMEQSCTGNSCLNYRWNRGILTNLCQRARFGLEKARAGDEEKGVVREKCSLQTGYMPVCNECLADIVGRVLTQWCADSCIVGSLPNRDRPLCLSSLCYQEYSCMYHTWGSWLSE